MKRSSVLFASILIASALLLSAASNGASLRGGHEAATDADSQINNRQPPQLIPPSVESEIVKALRAIVTEQQAARHEQQLQEKRWWPPSASWAIVYVTVVYVLVAFFQLHSISRQADIAERILSETRSSERARIAFELDNVEGLDELLAFRGNVPHRL
jgi:hypothetical protein